MTLFYRKYLDGQCIIPLRPRLAIVERRHSRLSVDLYAWKAFLCEDNAEFKVLDHEAGLRRSGEGPGTISAIVLV